MSRFSDRSFLRVATVGALVAALIAALGLAACGRKGPLDPPPDAAIPATPQARNSALVNPIGASPLGEGRTSRNALEIGPNGQPRAPKGPKKYIPLDVLLN